MIQNAIDELKDPFHSIDVRVFSFKQDNVWKNIFTIIRFRSETENELKTIHEELIKKRGVLETEKFRMGLFHFSLTNWDKICKDASNKFICLNENYAVNFFESVNLRHTSIEPNPEPGNYIDKEWKFLRSYHETSSSSRPSYQDELRDEVLKNGFSNVDDYLSAVFQFDKYDFQHNPWIYVFVPVFFKTEKILFEHDKVNVEYTAYEQKDIQITFNFYNSVNRRVNEEFVEQKIQKLTLKDESKIINDKTIIGLQTDKISNSFELLVIKNKKILIERKEGRIGDYWKGRSEYTNPLYFVFEKFVNYDELEKMLFEFKSKDLGDDSKVFERGVSWLLSLLGFSNVLLNNYEKIGEGSHKISTDILCSLNDNRLFLVNATTGLPKQSDFDREKEYRENLAKLLTNKKLQVFSVYFTGKEATESENSARTNNVTLIGKSKLKILLEHLKKGDLEKARKIILNEDF